MSVKDFYRRYVHYLRSALAFVLAVAYQLASAGPDTISTWTVRQWVWHGVFSLGAMLVPLMRAGDFTPNRAGQLVQLPDPPKDAA